MCGERIRWFKACWWRGCPWVWWWHSNCALCWQSPGWAATPRQVISPLFLLSLLCTAHDSREVNGGAGREGWRQAMAGTRCRGLGQIIRCLVTVHASTRDNTLRSESVANRYTPHRHCNNFFNIIFSWNQDVDESCNQVEYLRSAMDPWGSRGFRCVDQN